MKKIMIVAAAALWGTVAFSVESGNIVGYTTKTLTKQVFRLAGLSFEGVGTDGYNLNDICPYSTEVTYSDPVAGICAWWSTAPQIQVQKANGMYDIYYFLADAWYAEDSYKPGWVDANGTLATPELYDNGSGAAVLDGESVPGQAVWFKDPLAEQNVNLVSSGQVISEDVDIACPAVFRLRASAQAGEMELNSADVIYSNMPEVYYSEPVAGICAWWSTAPQIQIQKANGMYDIYYYIQDAWYADESYKPGWVDANGTLATPELFASEAAVLNGVVPAGGGFWAKGVSQSFNIKFKAK